MSTHESIGSDPRRKPGLDRRSFLRTMCLGGLATFALPSVSLATVPQSGSTRGRLVFVLLRGGFDGLAALVPTTDPRYAAVRGSMALDPAELTPLADGFALAPGLAPLTDFWQRGELVALHAMAIPYRTRSHFDGQAILETGLDQPRGSADGWLNRLLQVMDGERSGIAVAAGMPRSLAGEYPVASWSPAELGEVEGGYLARLHRLYQHDADLLDPFEAALQLGEIGGSEMTAGAGRRGGGGRGSGGLDGRSAAVFAAAARFLAQEDGPNVAAVELSGWDTHANQGLAGGPLDRQLGRLAEGLVTLRRELGERWRETTVVVMTEFGRTVRPNGTGGTDHGTAGAGFLLGPRLARSAVVADWPGLAEGRLFEGRDLRPTLDTRAVLKGVVAGAFDLTATQADRIFPGSETVRGRYDLMA